MEGEVVMVVIMVVVVMVVVVVVVVICMYDTKTIHQCVSEFLLQENSGCGRRE